MAANRITDMPNGRDLVRFKPGLGQRFVLTVDTEEEFDWQKPLNRTDHSIYTIPRLAKFQQFCEGLGILPIYLLDFPIATSPMAADILREPLAAGRAEIGIQLHPWVSPPHSEEVTEFNSFAGNLPAELERDKILRLRVAIQQNFDCAPLIYRAGRYGAGPNTAQILSDSGIAIDTSVRARFDYSSTGGPNFRDHPLVPYWLDRDAGLLELPLTTVYWGMLRRQGPWLYPAMWRAPRLRGALARINLLERIPLTPEGVTLKEAIRAIDMALDDGLPLLVFSFHSPSLAPGNTPYVRSEEDLDDFYAWWRSVFAYLAQRGVMPSSVKDILDSVELATSQPAG